MRTFKYHNDPSHGWLAVKLDLLDRLDLVDKITAYSYIKGKTVYLEEDLDCTTFLKEYKKMFGEFQQQSLYYNGRCPVRGYESYSPTLAREILSKCKKSKVFC
jgi:hypothetical protein